MKFFLTLLPFLAFAAPQGLQVMSGSAEIVGHEVRVTESSVLHWDSYSIAAHEHIHYPFSHPTLNRVTSDLPSEIYGRLSSNGPLWLINSNGIVIGESGRINAASFLASTLDLLDGPEFVFAGDRGRIEQHGVIECPGGYVMLMAAEGVEQTGTIRAEKVGIGAGREIVFMPKDALFEVSCGFAKAAIQCKGLIEATRMEERGGEVYLVADAVVVGKEGVLRGKEILVWGEERTEFWGKAEGEFVEVSSPRWLEFWPTEMQAKKLLLDPPDVTISNANSPADVLDGCMFNPGSTNPVTINVATLAACLENGDVEINTMAGSGGGTGIITVSNTLSWMNAHTLTLVADRNIAINAAIENMSPMTGFTAIDFTANGTPTASYDEINVNNVTVSTIGGKIKMESKGNAGGRGIRITGNSGGLVTSVDGNIELIGVAGSNGGATGYGLHLDTGITTGRVITTGSGALTLSGTSPSARGVWFNPINTVASMSGDVSVTGVVLAGATASMAEGIRFVTTNPISTSSGNITLNGTSHSSGTSCYGIVTNPLTGSSGTLQITGLADGGDPSSFDILFSSSSYTNTGPIIIHSPLTLVTSTTITSMNTITFSDAVNPTTTSNGLTVNANSAPILFQGALGNITRFASVSLTTTHSIGVELHANATASSFTTTGTTKTKLFQPTTTIDTTGAISFGGTVDGNAAGMQALTLAAGGAVTLSSAIGGSLALGDFECTGSQINVANNITASSILTHSPVTLINNSIMTASTIHFADTVNGSQDLTLNAGAGTITFGDVVGGTTPLGIFEATASNVVLNADITATQGTFDADVTVMGNISLQKSGP